jgi:hypothetical protein
MSDFVDQLSRDAADVFLSDDLGAVSITRFIGGDPNDSEPLRAIVDWDAEVDGATARAAERTARTTDKHGRRAPSYCVLEILASQEAAEGDRFAVPLLGKTVLVNFVRQTGADEGMQSILCEEPGNRTTKTPRLRA